MVLDTTPQKRVEPLPAPQIEQLTFSHKSLPEVEEVMPDVVAPEWSDVVSESEEKREKWFVQVGLFADLDNAKKLQTQVKEAGYPSELMTQRRDNKTHQLVWVGPYFSQSEAELVLQSIKKKPALAAAHDGWVVRQQ